MSEAAPLFWIGGDVASGVPTPLNAGLGVTSLEDKAEGVGLIGRTQTILNVFWTCYRPYALLIKRETNSTRWEAVNSEPSDKDSRPLFPCGGYREQSRDRGHRGIRHAGFEP